MESEFNWEDGLKNLFAGMLNQEPLQDAAELMVTFSSVDQRYHAECQYLFEKAKALAREGDDAIISYINVSGYKVSSFEEALELINDFEREYLEAFASSQD